MKRIIALLALFLGLGLVTSAQVLAQAPALPDAPVSHVSVSATFTGINVSGTMQPATIETLGVDLTKEVQVGYEHISVPALNARYELGLLNYHFTFPKFKALVFDTSNFVGSVCAGAGKYLSPQGNHWAETACGSIMYPMASHVGWQVVSYQYIHSPVSGVINKSYQTASTGPIVYF